jgi:transcription antitermination factor NusG
MKLLNLKQQGVLHMMDKEKFWFALYTRSRAEKHLAQELSQDGYEVYLPLIKTRRQWKDRKKWVEVPLFHSYIFIRMSRMDYFKIIRYNNAVCFIKFDNELADIPEWQINNLKILINSREKFDQSSTKPELGERVSVQMGALKGLVGNVIEHRGSNKVVIRIDTIDQNLIVDIDPAFLQREKLRKIS